MQDTNGQNPFDGHGNAPHGAGAPPYGSPPPYAPGAPPYAAPPYASGAPAYAVPGAPAHAQKKKAERSAAKQSSQTLRNAIVIILVSTAALFVLVMGVSSAVENFFGSSTYGTPYIGPGTPYLAKVSVVGEIGGAESSYLSSDSGYHHYWTIQTIDTLMNDANNVGIYLYLDTPGGTVYESDDLYLKLMEYKEVTGRPIYAYMGSMAASGGYYAAAAADEIWANRNTWTGSIGVTMGTMIDVSVFLENHGIHTETITSGRNKAMGGYYDPITEEQLAIFQGLVDDAYHQFVGIVAESRGLDSSVAYELADGRVYTASQAAENGLIDGIMQQTEAENAFLAKFENGAVLDVAYYYPDGGFLSFLQARLGGIGTPAALSGGEDGISAESYDGDVAAVLDYMQRQEADGRSPLKYLYEG